jgi:hypothetical protein
VIFKERKHILETLLENYELPTWVVLRSGWAGRRASMIVNYLHIVGIPFKPTKTDSPFFVDANAVLAFTISLQAFQAVSWRAVHVC